MSAPSLQSPPLKLRGCVHPPGRFVYGLHQPGYRTANLRRNDHSCTLGKLNEQTVDNAVNLPAGDVHEPSGRPIYEISNPLPFRGVTYIDSGWAAPRAAHPESIRLNPPPACAFSKTLASQGLDRKQCQQILAALPRPLRYALAANATEENDLVALARSCARFLDNDDGRPVGLQYRHGADGQPQALIDDHDLFETIANNPHLPDDYKRVMVLRPGVQGGSEIVGEWDDNGSHIFEYLRRNSYISGGHYAANMAHDSVRYTTAALTAADMHGLRHLYYQRIYVSLAEALGLTPPVRRRPLSATELEDLRLQVLASPRLADLRQATLWGWNFGYDISASGYRLHASHQQIHQQFALVGETVPGHWNAAEAAFPLPAYSCGDLVTEHLQRYHACHERDFFVDYLRAIEGNQRMDGAQGPASLVVWRDDRVMLLVPKAQVSQWELQIMAAADLAAAPVANILQADPPMRASLDNAILIAQQIFARLGARMVTSIEYGGRIGAPASGQRLLYSLLPKLPWAMGAFSEAQLRFICGHFPEDFAEACRRQLAELIIS